MKENQWIGITMPHVAKQSESGERPRKTACKNYCTVMVLAFIASRAAT